MVVGVAAEVPGVVGVDVGVAVGEGRVPVLVGVGEGVGVGHGPSTGYPRASKFTHWSRYRPLSSRLIGNSMRPVGFSFEGGRWRHTQMVVWSGPLPLLSVEGDDVEEVGNEAVPVAEGVLEGGGVEVAPGDEVAVAPLVGDPEGVEEGAEGGVPGGLVVGLGAAAVAVAPAVAVGGALGRHGWSPPISIHPRDLYRAYSASVSGTSTPARRRSPVGG